MRTRRRLLVPEVVQTSAMDCGPASLKCLLEGFGIPVSYGRLREACQTDVDGTSIDTIEEAAVQLGLDAEQIMVPADHVLLTESQALPAILVVQLANGVTHFVVAWQRHGPLVQLMDPGTGRRWISAKRFFDEIYVHTQPVAAADWRVFVGTDQFCGPLRWRLADIGASRRSSDRLIEQAAADPSWRGFAALDAAARMTKSLIRSGGLRKGAAAARVIEEFAAKPQIIPADYWSVQAASDAIGGEDQLLMRGAVLVRVRGRAEQAPAAEDAAQLSPELAAALTEVPSRPGRDLFHMLKQDGLFAPGALVTALAVATGGVLLEAVLFRGLFDLGRDLGLAGQRLAALGALLLFIAGLLLLELPVAVSLLRWGRRLELRLRMAFLDKIPKLSDRYFHSRLTSDMAERCHSINRIRHLPELGGQLTRRVFELLLTTAGVIWLDPATLPLVSVAALTALVLPLVTQPMLSERDLRVRSHAGALARYYLDSLLGLVAIRVHGAERALRREHEKLLVEWARAGFGLQRTAIWIQAVQLATGFGLAVWLLLDHLSRTGDIGGVLLLVYWALNIPVLGQGIAQVAWQYPGYRNTALRLMEPLGALEETPVLSKADEFTVAHAKGVALAFEKVTIRAAGRLILDEIDIRIEPGSHVAIVGPSGAGKSSLVGILLGWHRPAAGCVLVDGEPIEGKLDVLRRQTALVDPAVQIWNRSFLDNICYGTDADRELEVGAVIESANLRHVLEQLPGGLQTKLGESGGLVSGGEGQRVRLGRAMLRPDVRLVILDEPFRGLDGEQRRELLARARKLWRHATLLCIMHNLEETREFERVIVVERGRIAEDGPPKALAARPDSRYRTMLDAEEALRTGLWSRDGWRQLWLEDGELTERYQRGGQSA
jgi:ABC-type bacteriocin/lantibiotic exporter with double-glycine peptidase domain